jgi:hypothetical protein
MIDALRGWIILHRDRLKWLFRISGVVLPLITIVIALFFEDWKIQQFLWFYIAPIFFVFSLWAQYRLLEIHRLSRGQFVVDGLVVVLSIVRSVPNSILPYSGHALFLCYSGIVQTTWFYRLVAALLLLETTYFKWFVSNNPLSWILGITLGILAALIFFLFKDIGENGHGA